MPCLHREKTEEGKLQEWVTVLHGWWTSDNRWCRAAGRTHPSGIPVEGPHIYWGADIVVELDRFHRIYTHLSRIEEYALSLKQRGVMCTHGDKPPVHLGIAVTKKALQSQAVDALLTQRKDRGKLFISWKGSILGPSLCLTRLGRGDRSHHCCFPKMFSFVGVCVCFLT